MDKIIMNIVSMMGDSLTNEEIGVILKYESVKDEIQKEFLEKHASPEFVGRITREYMKVMNDFQNDIEQRDDLKTEEDFMYELFIRIFGFYESFQSGNLGKYAEDKLRQLYNDRGVDYDLATTASKKVQEAFKDKEKIKELLNLTK